MTRSRWAPARPAARRRPLATAALALSVLLLGSCDPGEPGSDLLEEAPPGASWERLVDIIGEGPFASGDLGRRAILHGYPSERYLIDGRQIEVIYYVRPTARPDQVDTRRHQTPVIVVDGALDGWGWSHFDHRKEEWGLRDRTTEEEGAS